METNPKVWLLQIYTIQSRWY